MQWTDEWKYAKNRKLKLALKKLERQLWAILLNPEKFLLKRSFCIEKRIKECPFKFKHSLTGLFNINFCLAPESFCEQKPSDCFLLPYCKRGNERAMNEKAWKRRVRNNPGGK